MLNSNRRMNPMVRRGCVLLVCAFCGLASPPDVRAIESDLQIDFAAAMAGISFDPATADGNLDAAGLANGIKDAVELGLLTAILENPTLDLSATGGVDHRSIVGLFLAVREVVAADVKAIERQYPTAVDAVSGYVMLGSGSRAAISTMTGHVGAPLKGDYSRFEKLTLRLSPQGDADGDGVANQVEHDAFIGEGADAYYAAALDPTVKPDAAYLAKAAAAPAKQRDTRKVVGIVLYPGFEVLDVYGPVEMWSYVREFKLITVAENAGPVMSAQNMATVADFSFDNAPDLDILMVPGGFGTREQLDNPALLNFLRKQHEHTELTTSVCTGSALLAGAGILKGHRATANKRFFSLSRDQGPDVKWVEEARWVEDGKIITSSGVSAGTDMALGLIAKLYGKERAEQIASGVEYEWHDDPTIDPFAKFVRRD